MEFLEVGSVQLFISKIATISMVFIENQSHHFQTLPIPLTKSKIQFQQSQCSITSKEKSETHILTAEKKLDWNLLIIQKRDQDSRFESGISDLSGLESDVDL
jgi:hypothetical protein